jgi:hypothetical protein
MPPEEMSTATPATTETPSALPSSDTQQTPLSTSQGSAPAESSSPAMSAPPGWVNRDGAWYFQAKVDGEDVEIPYEDAASRLRTHESSTKRYQEAKRIEREMEQLLGHVASSPKAFADFARQLGVDPRQLAEQWMVEHLETEKLTPEQRRIRELEAQLERGQQTERERQQRAEEAQRAEVTQRERQQLVQTFDSALDAHNAPKGERVRSMIHQRMAQLASWHEQNGVHTTLGAIAKKATADVMGLASEFGVVGQPPPVAQTPASAPKAAIPPPPPANAQAPSQHMRDDRGRFLDDPRPTVHPNIPGSMDALLEWKKRHPNAR